MKIAAFYSDSPFAGWVQAEGFADVLKRIGHEVMSIAVPPINQITQAMADKVNKPIDDCDMVIVSGPEWLRKWIQAFYPNWSKMKCPKVGWYHESFVREDFTLNYADYEGMFDFHFFPDRADAEKYKGEFLPLGVDTEIFNSGNTERDIEVGFIGLMYPKRAQFVQELKSHLGDIEIKYMVACQSKRGLIPAIGVWDADGLNIRRSMELLAETYRRIKVFVTFPSLSNVLVAKVLESMACGCCLVAPKQPVELFSYQEYVGSYQCAEFIREVAEDSHYAKAQAKAGCDYVHKNHRMELRFEQIFAKVGLAKCAH
jgi:glycosyltransferase involved in cell wall biosynthesis